MTAPTLPVIAPPTQAERLRRVKGKLAALRLARDEAVREVWRARRQCPGESDEWEKYGRLLQLLRSWPAPGA